MNLNKVILIGRIASDISISESKSGVVFARFSLAITRDNFSNEKDEIADFISIVAFRNNATFLSKYFNKGDLVNIVGSLQSSQYTSKSGDLISSLNVVVDQVKSLEPRAVTQARAERNTGTISTSSITTEKNNEKPTFYEENKKEESSSDDDNPWELDF